MWKNLDTSFCQDKSSSDNSKIMFLLRQSYTSATIVTDVCHCVGLQPLIFLGKRVKIWHQDNESIYMLAKFSCNITETVKIIVLVSSLLWIVFNNKKIFIIILSSLLFLLLVACCCGIYFSLLVLHSHMHSLFLSLLINCHISCQQFCSLTLVFVLSRCLLMIASGFALSQTFALFS